MVVGVGVGWGVLGWGWGGSPVGKISAPFWSRLGPAIAINERKRPVRQHKGRKKGTITDGERLEGWMDERGGAERRRGERDSTQRQKEGLKSLLVGKEQRRVTGKLQRSVMRNRDKPPG